MLCAAMSCWDSPQHDEASIENGRSTQHCWTQMELRKETTCCMDASAEEGLVENR
jgi:hypothetical protein